MKAKFLMLIICFIITMAVVDPVKGQSSQKGYSITLEISSLTNGASVYLQKYRGKTLIPVDSINVITTDKPIFSASAFLPSGMYAIVIKPAKRIDFFISDGESHNFTIIADINNPLKSLSFKNSRENQVFADFQRYMESLHYQRPDRMVQEDMRKETEDFERVSPESMLSLFIRSISDPDIPDPKIPAFVLNRDQAIQDYYYHYMVNHFFDNFSFSNPGILKMPVFEEKTSLYFGQIVNPLPDTLIIRIGQFLKKTKVNDEVYNWTVRYLYDHFRESSRPGSTEVFNFIAEQYILKEPGRWNDPGFVAKVRERVAKAKLNKVGLSATNLILITPEGKNRSLHSVSAPLTVLYFFNPGCEACLSVTDALYKLYKQNEQKGIRVYAVYLDRKKEEWLRYIQSKNLDWMNVYDPDGSQGIEQKYDIYAIPMIYLLDKDKKILKKDITVEALETYLSGTSIKK